MAIQSIFSCDQVGTRDMVGSAPGLCRKNNEKLKQDSTSAAVLHLPVKKVQCTLNLYCRDICTSLCKKDMMAKDLDLPLLLISAMARLSVEKTTVCPIQVWPQT